MLAHELGTRRPATRQIPALIPARALSQLRASGARRRRLAFALNRRAAGAAAALAAGALLAGCASANKTTTAPASAAAAGGAGAMNMGATGAAVAAAGTKPVPTQVLASTTWQGMRITAEATTPVPFVVYNGTSEQVIKPGKASFHLMVMLSDAQTGVAIPYASVWATISRAGKVVYDERQWPMISRYMGPHYGNDVSVPGAGDYQLSLLVSPPVSARHVEYQNVWLSPHRVNVTFHWKALS